MVYAESTAAERDRLIVLDTAPVGTVTSRRYPDLEEWMPDDETGLARLADALAGALQQRQQADDQADLRRRVEILERREAWMLGGLAAVSGVLVLATVVAAFLAAF